MTIVAPSPRRRVAIPLRQPARIALPPARKVSKLAFVGLVATLPLFAQVFHYLNELPPPYYLSKGWPILVILLTLYGAIRMHLPGRDLFLLLLAYLLGFTPLVSIIQLGNGLVDAIATTVKAWPFTYYFALSALLTLIAVPPQQLRAACLGYGIATFVLAVAIYILAPASWYVTNPEDGKLLQYDQDRGRRVYLSMFFGMIFIFYLGRSFVIARKPLRLFLIPVCLLVQLFTYKQRTAIAAAILVSIYGIVMSLPDRPRRLAIGAGLALLVPMLMAAAIMLGLFGGTGGSGIQDSLGGSLSVRQNSMMLALHFLGDDPLRWTFGVGATTRFGSITLADIFGYDQFFIADLGWLGVVFEYGLIGALLILIVHVWGLVFTTRRGMALRDPFVLALSDYMLFLLVTSSVYSLVFLPGEFAAALALAVHLSSARQYADHPANAAPACRLPTPNRIPSQRKSEC